MDEIELRKENVQPLKKGRNAARLGEALASQETQEQQRARDEQRRGFLEEIDQYSGDDPLEVWCRYIAWVEETFPAGNGGLLTVLERCTRELQATQQYKNDFRYLRVWIKYADSCREPEDIFKFMQENDIGQRFDTFYYSYAVFSECRHNFARASELYELGIARNVQGKERLRTKYGDFQHRMAKRAQRQQEDYLSGAAPGAQPGHEQRDYRSSLHQLSGRGSLHQQGNSSRHKRRAPSQPSSNTGGGGLQVFDDFAGGATGGASQTQRTSTVQWNRLGHQHEVRKENERQTEAWAGIRMPQKRARSEYAPVAPSLEVMPDDDLPQAAPARGPAQPEPSLRLRMDGPGPAGGEVDEQSLSSNPLMFMRGEAAPPPAGLQPAQPVPQGGQDREARKKNELRGFDEEALVGPDGEERCFEEIRAEAWLRAHAAHRNPPAPAPPGGAFSIHEDSPAAGSARPVALAIRADSPQRLAPLGPAAGGPAGPDGVGAARSFTPLPAAVDEGALQVYQDTPVEEAPPALTDIADEPAAAPAAADAPPSGGVGIGLPVSNRSVVTPSPQLEPARLNITPSPAVPGAAAVPSPALPSPAMPSPAGGAPEVTIHTQEAFSDIMSMFSDSIPLGSGTRSERRKQKMSAQKGPAAATPAPPSAAGPSLQVFSENAPAAPPMQAMQILPNAAAADPSVGDMQILPDAPPADEGGFGIFRDDEFRTENLPPGAVLAATGTAEEVGSRAEAAPETGRENMAGAGAMPLGDVVALPQAEEEEVFDDDGENQAPGPALAAAGGVLAPRRLEGPALQSAMQDLSADRMAALGITLTNVEEAREEDEEQYEDDGMARDPLEALRNAGPPPGMELRDDFVVFEDGSHSVDEGSAADRAQPAGSASSEGSTGDQPASLHPAPTHLFGPDDASRAEGWAERQHSSPRIPDHTQEASAGDSMGPRSEDPGDTLTENTAETERGPAGSGVRGMESGEEVSRMEAGSDGAAAAAGGEERVVLNPFEAAVVGHMVEEATEGVALSEVEGVFSHDEAAAPEVVLNALRDASRQRRTRRSSIVPPTTMLHLGETTYLLKGTVGNGAKATVYEAYPLMDEDDLEAADDEGNVFVLKVQRPACPWEYLALQRLAARLPEDLHCMFVKAHRLHLYGADASLLLLDHSEHMTLQGAVETYHRNGQQMDELIAIYYAIELLTMVEGMNRAGMIHTGVRPDNLLLRNGSGEWEEWAPWRPGSWRERGLLLIDFGEAIDLHTLPPGTSFVGASHAEGHRCLEMQEGTEWGFQADFYGICGVVHWMLFGKDMAVERVEVMMEDGSKEVMTQPCEDFKQTWQVELWDRLFRELLNPEQFAGKGCTGSNMVDLLEPLRVGFEEYLVCNPEKMRSLRLTLMKQTIFLDTNN